MYWHNTENIPIYKELLDIYQKHETNILETHAINEQSLHVNEVKVRTNYMIQESNLLYNNSCSSSSNYLPERNTSIKKASRLLIFKKMQNPPLLMAVCPRPSPLLWSETQTFKQSAFHLQGLVLASSLHLWYWSSSEGASLLLFVLKPVITCLTPTTCLKLQIGI